MRTDLPATIPTGRWWCSECRKWMTAEHVFLDSHEEDAGAERPER